MKKVLILAAAALALAACAKQQEIPAEETQPMAVGFDAYLNRSVTKAETTTTSIQGADGFGIFAYYTDNDNYDGTSIPNFMYNQQVTHAGSWKYSPVKYWPNEYGDKAVAEESDRISFFAYAPYVEANTSGKPTTAVTNNIVGFTRNNYSGDPLVKYVVDLDPATSVDLVWGRQPGDNSFVAYDGTTYATTALEGLPWLNVRRPKYATNETVLFQFDHALASLNVTVDHYADAASFDNNTPSNNENVDGNTRIWIRSITFTGFATEGALNLNNVATHQVAVSSTDKKIGTALWESINGDDLITGDEVTIFDGRKDGKEGTSAASNEKYTGLNPNLVQSAPYDLAPAAGGNDVGNMPVTSNAWVARNSSGMYSGVLNGPQNLFASTTATDPVYVIPTGDPVTVTIAYDVETKDDKLATYLSDNVTHGSSISNVITKKVLDNSSNAIKLENGKKYTIKLHLGMNSVKVDAAVTGWGDATTGSADLPLN